MGRSINLSQEPKGYKQDAKGSTQLSHVHDVQTNIHILDYSRQANWKHNIYKDMQGTKLKHAIGASNFQCKEFKYKLPQGGTLDIR